MITAATITVEQIRALLRESLHDEPTYWACRQALDETIGRVTAAQIAYARGLCADFINVSAAQQTSHAYAEVHASFAAEPQWSPYDTNPADLPVSLTTELASRESARST